MNSTGLVPCLTSDPELRSILRDPIDVRLDRTACRSGVASLRLVQVSKGVHPWI